MLHKVKGNGNSSKIAKGLTDAATDVQSVEVSASDLAAAAKNVAEAEGLAQAAASALAGQAQPRTLGERLSSLEELNRLANIHEKLSNKKKELNALIEANDRGAVTAVFRSDSGDVSVQNSGVIAEAIFLMCSKIEEMAAKTANEITALTV